MAKGSALTSGGDPMHTRTTAGIEESEVAVLGIDGSDSVVPADTSGLAVQGQGLVAHDSVDAGSPVKIGGKAAPGTPAAVASGDRVDAHFDTLGRLGVWLGGKGSANAATLIPRGTVPGPSDVGLAVVPLNVARPSYQAVTGEITSGTAVAVANSMTIWHPATLAKDVFILEIGVNNRIVQTAGTYSFELSFISAENATPGGTAITPQQLDNSNPASGLTVRQSPAAPTLKGQIFQRAAQLLPAAATPLISSYDGVVVYRAKDLDDYSDAIRLQTGVAEGIVVRQNILAALTTAPVFSVYARWVERA